MFRAAHHERHHIDYSIALLSPSRAVPGTPCPELCLVWVHRSRKRFSVCPAQPGHPLSIETTVLGLALIPRHSELYSEFIEGIPTSMSGLSRKSSIHGTYTSAISKPQDPPSLVHVGDLLNVVLVATLPTVRLCYYQQTLFYNRVGSHFATVFITCFVFAHALLADLFAILSVASDFSILRFGSKGGAIITSLLSWQRS